MTTMRAHGRVSALVLLVVLVVSCGDDTAPNSPTGTSPATAVPEQSEHVVEPPVPPEPDIEAQISRFIRRIHEDRNGHFWFGTNGDGVARYDGTSLDYFSTRNGFGGVAVRAIREDGQGRLWFGTDGGVTRYEKGTFTNFTEEDGLGANDVWSLCLDREGTLWVGTLGGACRFDEASGRFTPFELPPAAELDPLRGVTSPLMIRSIMQDRDGDMWFAVGTAGVYRYDGKTLTHLSEQDGLSNGSVNCMLQDRNGVIWFATHHGGVCRYDGKSVTRVTEKEDGVGGVEVWDLYADRAGNIWFPSEGFGMYRYDGTTFTNFSKQHGLATHAPQSSFQDRLGRLWVGGWLGLYRFDGTSFVNVTREGPWD